MFIKSISISNYRLYGPVNPFILENVNVPDGHFGSGLNVLIGENGSGKTTILDAISLPMLDYKSESFCIDDINDLSYKTNISVRSDHPFTVKGTMPNSSFECSGLSFVGGLRSRAASGFLASMCVSDRLYIPVDPSKPKPNSPDLRVSVDNPFSGPRFKDTDVLFLDKNRTNQARSGSFGRTRFDRLMGDFNFQYVHATNPLPDLNKNLDEAIKADKVSSRFLTMAVKDFREMCGVSVRLDFVKNNEPFDNAFFAVPVENGGRISLSRMGSGLEMVFCILYSFRLAQQNGRKLIIIIDEPELHLHPRLQESFVKYIAEASAQCQVFVATHSPLFVKQAMQYERSKFFAVRRTGLVSSMDERCLPYLSANEINYIAFGLATAEYHNELYNELKSASGISGVKDFDAHVLAAAGEPVEYPWRDHPNSVTLHTYVRNKIHHSEAYDLPSDDELSESIKGLRRLMLAGSSAQDTLEG